MCKTTDGAGRCPHCGRPYPTRDFALPGHKPMLITMPCDCDGATAEHVREERERERAERVRAFGEAWARSGVPEEFRHVDADFSMADRLMSHGAVWITGRTGRGKSHRACQYAKGYLIRATKEERGIMRCTKSMLFLAAETVQCRLRSTWDRWDQSEEDLFQRWTGVDLLVLDDVGKGKPTETAAENVFRIVRARQEGHKETIFTSQYTTNALTGRYSTASGETNETMRSRLRGWCAGVVLEGPDRRTGA